MIEFAAVIVFWFALWCLSNLIGWLSVRDAGYRPFNWRIIWVPAYYAWIDRRINDAEDAL